MQSSSSSSVTIWTQSLPKAMLEGGGEEEEEEEEEFT